MRLFIISLLVGFRCWSAMAQAITEPYLEKEKIKKTILELFDAYRTGDSARVASVFTNDASIQTLQKDKEGVVVVSKSMPVTRLTTYIGSGLTEIHDERLWNTQIFYDDFMATVWTNYAFYLGKKFLHCGTETFLLRKLNGEWKIFYLADTRQLENCNIPADIK